MKLMGQFMDGRMLVEMDPREIQFLHNMIDVLQPVDETATAYNIQFPVSSFKAAQPPAPPPPAPKPTPKKAKPAAKKAEKKLYPSDLAKKALVKRDKKCRLCKSTFTDFTKTNCRAFCDKCTTPKGKPAKALPPAGKPSDNDVLDKIHQRAMALQREDQM
jgi:hypothetical protein